MQLKYLATAKLTYRSEVGKLRPGGHMQPKELLNLRSHNNFLSMTGEKEDPSPSMLKCPLKKVELDSI